jgi:caspase domain-containing protein/Sel1 repeat-containing protein
MMGPTTFALRRTSARALAWLAVLALAVLSDCGSTGGPGAPPSDRGTGNPDDFLIVDCLLPGQLRQLGQNMTYLSRRQPAKVSARECQIRGGEYTASGQTTAATALAVWLPRAEQGDASAQTFVGEIYEKGLGVPPDYGTAALWYRKAADQGFARAAINLGALYAQGLGVPKDPQQALDWYAKAAGQQSGVVFEVPPSELLDEVAKLRRELDQKQHELERTRKELEQLRSRVEHGQETSDSERRELEKLQAELATAQGSSAGSARAGDLQRQIAEREQKLAASEHELAGLRTSLERLQAASDAQRERIAALEGKSAEIPPQIQLDEPELAQTRGTSIARVRPGASRAVVAGRAESVSGIAAVTINDRPVKTEGGRFKVEIPTRESSVRIVATDRSRRTASLEFVFPGAADVASADQPVGHAMAGNRRGFGSYHALVIGNDDYRFLPKLTTAASDAKSVASLLRDQYGFDTILLLDAKRYDILSALNALREKLTADDNLIIFYAGHGELDRANQSGNWLPVDAERANTANWISNATITDLLNAMAVRQLLVVADSCYSGTLARSAQASIARGVGATGTLQLMEEMARQRSRMVLTSGGVEPVIDNAGGAHSVFARSFVALLRDNVGVLPGRELFESLHGQVARDAETLGLHQVPEYAPIKFAGHEAGDFFFVKAN